MPGIRLSVLIAAAVATAGCADSTVPSSLLDDREVTADVAATSGDAIAQAVGTMIGNQMDGGMTFVAGERDAAHDVTHNRTRTCFDAAGAVVAGCSPMSSVRKIATRATVDGTRSGTRTTTGGATVTWTGAVHRVHHDTLTRTFTTAQPPVETSRSHTGVSTGNDTTSFADGTVSRTVTEASVDSVRAVTWNLPRSSNPWPVSGSIVRNTTVKVVVTRDSKTETRNLTRRVQVTFPADAQGNVTLLINDKTCNLNLETRRVTNCQ